MDQPAASQLYQVTARRSQDARYEPSHACLVTRCASLIFREIRSLRHLQAFAMLRLSVFRATSTKGNYSNHINIIDKTHCPIRTSKLPYPITTIEPSHRNSPLLTPPSPPSSYPSSSSSSSSLPPYQSNTNPAPSTSSKNPSKLSLNA
jgi:hypothetical protein